MKKVRDRFIKTLPYLCLIGVFALGLMTIVGTGGGGGDGNNGQPTSGNFSCNINSETYTPLFKCYRERDGGIEIWGVTRDEMRFVLIKITKPTDFPATVELGLGVNQLDWAMYDTNSSVDGGEYYTYAPSSGTVTINSIDDNGCSGSFEFRARIRGTDDEVNITDGNFNVGSSFCEW